MAGVTIEFSANEVLNKLLSLEETINNLSPIFEHMGEALLDIHDARFKSQESPDGIPWQELSPWYKESKPKQQDKILTLDGVLRSTLHPQIEENVLLFGTNVPYGAIHQFGGTIKPVTAKALNVGDRPIKQVVIPARPWLGISDKNELLLADIVREHLENAL